MYWALVDFVLLIWYRQVAGPQKDVELEVAGSLGNDELLNCILFLNLIIYIYSF